MKKTKMILACLFLVTACSNKQSMSPSLVSTSEQKMPNLQAPPPFTMPITEPPSPLPTEPTQKMQVQSQDQQVASSQAINTSETSQSVATPAPKVGIQAFTFSQKEMESIKFNSYAIIPNPEGAQNLSAPVLGNIETSLVPGVTCPLVDNQPNLDLIAAARNLSNQLSSFKTACSGGFIGTDTSEVDTVQKQIEAIVAAGQALKGISEDPSQVTADPTRLQEAQNHVATVIQGIQSISGVLSKNALFGKSCAQNLPTTTDVVMSLSGLVQAVAPIALQVLAAVPEFAPAIPFVMGLSSAGNVAQVLGRFQQQGSLNMKDPKIRLAVLQNICEFTRIQQRVSALNEGRMSALPEDTGDLGQISTMSEKLSIVAPPALMEKIQSSHFSLMSQAQLKSITSPQLKILIANQKSAAVETNRRSVLANANASKISFIEIEDEMRATKMALFGKPEALFLSPFSPVLSWYNEVERQAKNFQGDFNTQVRKFRSEVQKSVTFTSSNFVDSKNGRLVPPKIMMPWQNRNELQKSLDQVNQLTALNLQKYKEGGSTHQLICKRLKNILNDWQSVLDHVGALVEYCDYIRPYMDSTFDDRIIKACIGDLSLSSNLSNSKGDLMQFKTSGLTQLRHRFSNDSAEDAQIFYSKYEELKCTQYYR